MNGQFELAPMKLASIEHLSLLANGAIIRSAAS